MNLHVPQSLCARAECLSLLGPQVINSSNGCAGVFPVQGDRLGTYLMTQEGATLTKNQWSACLCRCTDSMVARAIEDPPTSYPTPAARFWSLALPSDYNWTKRGVVITQGRLVRGHVDKNILMTLVKDVAIDRSNDEALDFLQNINRACWAYNSMVAPTTIRFEELCPSAGLTRKCQSIVRRAHADSKKHSSDVSECISRATQQVSAAVRAEQSKCRFHGMRSLVASGCKGTPVNARMMCGILGRMLSPEDVRGVFTPPEDNPKGGRRCFSTTDTLDPFMDGFVSSGYSTGMSLQKYAVHAASGRISLINSTMLVGRVGYMFRRLTTSLESCSSLGGSVIDTSTNSVVSFRYGDDGRSPFVCEHEKMILPSDTPPSRKTVALTAALQSDVRGILDMFPDARTRVFDVPVSIRRVLYDAKHRRCDHVDPNDNTWDMTQQIAQQHADYTQGSFLGHWVRIHLHPYATHELTASQTTWAIQEVDKRLWKSRLQDGEPVGCLASSAVSAAATQFTLNSFHNIGAGMFFHRTPLLRQHVRAPLTTAIPHETPYETRTYTHRGWFLRRSRRNHKPE